MKKKSISYSVITIFIAISVSFFLAFKNNDQDTGKNKQIELSSKKPKSVQPENPLSEQNSNKNTASITKNAPTVETNYSRESANLSFEGALLFEKSLDSKKIQSLLFSKKFGAQLDQFANQSAADSNASELSSVYKKMLDAQLKKNKINAQIGKFVCGTSICIGSLERGEDSEYSRWSDIFFSDPTVPSYGFTNTTIRLGENQYEHRFVFSTDPAANSIMVPRN